MCFTFLMIIFHPFNPINSFIHSLAHSFIHSFNTTLSADIHVAHSLTSFEPLLKCHLSEGFSDYCI